jgi:hypothetical protein
LSSLRVFRGFQQELRNIKNGSLCEGHEPEASLGNRLEPRPPQPAGRAPGRAAAKTRQLCAAARGSRWRRRRALADDNVTFVSVSVAACSGTHLAAAVQAVVPARRANGRVHAAQRGRPACSGRGQGARVGAAMRGALQPAPPAETECRAAAARRCRPRARRTRARTSPRSSAAARRGADRGGCRCEVVNFTLQTPVPATRSPRPRALNDHAVQSGPASFHCRRPMQQGSCALPA